jgi:uncharacterized protein YbaR (Trm112 family)
MISKKYVCPKCKETSSELAWIEKTAQSLGVQYRNVSHMARSSSSASYVCPHCGSTIMKSYITEESNENMIVSNTLKKVYPIIIAEVRKGMESMGIFTKRNKGENIPSYVFAFSNASHVANKLDSNGNLSITTFNMGKLSLPEVKLKDGSKNTDHQDELIAGGVHLEVSYSYESNRLTYVLKNKDNKPVFNLAESIVKYINNVAKIQGCEATKVDMTGIFTKDDRYVEHCSDCPERYRCSSAELRPEYRAVRR